MRRIEFECPKCGQHYAVPAKLAGRRFQCRTCDESIVAPMPDFSNEDVILIDPSELIEDDAELSDDDFDELDAPVWSRRLSSTKSRPTSKKKASSSGKRSKKRFLKGFPFEEDKLKQVVGLVVAAGLAVLFVMLKVGPFSQVAAKPVPQDVAQWQRVSIGPTGMSVKLPGEVKKSKMPTPTGPVDSWHFESGKQAWIASYENMPQMIDFSNRAMIQSAVVAEVRKRSNVKEVINSEPFRQTDGGYPYLVIFSENYTGGWSRQTAYVTTYLVFLHRHAITLSYISKEKVHRTVADKFFGTLDGAPANRVVPGRRPNPGVKQKPAFED